MKNKTTFIICLFLFIGIRDSSAQTSLYFNYVSDTTQTWTVPGCVTQATVQLWGAGGGGGYCGSNHNIPLKNAGGSGAYYEGVISGLTPGTILELYVPSGGEFAKTGFGGSGGWPGGGHGGDDTAFAEEGAGGGGYAAIQINGTYYVVAGAGGGGSAIGGLQPGYGGSGGATTGGNGGCQSNWAGYGGTISVGGLPGYSISCDSGTTGQAFAGGNGGGNVAHPCGFHQAGGGGGAGYYGGGGAGDEINGPGGGSSYPASAFTVNGITFTPISNLQGNAGSNKAVYLAPGSPPDTTIGMGGYAISGGNGLIIITYEYHSSPKLLITQTNPTCGICGGSITVKATGGGTPYTYLWTPTGQTNAIATGLCAGTYTVTVTDSCGGTSTESIILTAAPLSITTAINTPIKCNGNCIGSATATVGIGTSPYIYSWTPSGGNKATATGLCAGDYTITVTDKNGCTGTATAAITQPTAIKLAVWANNAFCKGEIDSATVTATGGFSPYTYSWNPSGKTTATVIGLSSGIYTITVTDSSGCTATNSVTIIKPPDLAVATSVRNIVCNGGRGTATINVTGGTSPYTYLWTPGSQTTATATGLQVGTYTVSVTDNHHCTTSASVTITQPSLVTAAISSTTNVTCYNGGNGSATVTGNGGTMPYTYLWNPGGNTNATATGLFALSYTATITDNNGCTATASVNLTEPTQVKASISEPRIICKDSTGILIATANGGTPPYQYKWSSGATNGIATITPIATNDYSVIVTDSHGCTASANIVLQYGPAFAVDITGKKSVCVGDSTEICANAIGAIDGVFYQWAPLNSSNSCVDVSPGMASVYTVTVVDGCGSTTTAETNIVTEPSPIVNMDVNFSQGCVPFCVQFINQSTLSKGKVAQYVWDFGLASGESDTSREKSPIYCYKTAGQYNVSLTVISDSGCSATLKKINMVTIYNPPKAAFTYSPNPVSILSPTVMFNDESKDFNGNNVIYWTWDFGDNSDSINNQQNPAHTYQDTGTYCVNLTVMSPEGCTDTTTNCLIIEPDFKLYIPSAFTPNGDGINEVFKPVGQYIKTFEMYIFNRWGEQIFHTTDLNGGWNGEVNGTGQVSPEDVYIYKIMVTDAENKQHSYVGNVTLLK